MSDGEQSASSRSRRRWQWPASADLDLVEVAPTRPTRPYAASWTTAKYKYEAAAAAKESREEGHERHRQGDEVPPQDRGRRLRHQDPQGRANSWVRATRSRSRSCSGAGRCSTPSWGAASSTGRRAGRAPRPGRGHAEAGRPQHDHGARSRQEGTGSARQEDPGRSDRAEAPSPTTPQPTTLRSANRRHRGSARPTGRQRGRRRHRSHRGRRSPGQRSGRRGDDGRGVADSAG